MRTPDMRFGPDEALLRATKVVEDCRANGSPRPVVRAFFDEPSFTVSYVVHDPETRAAAIIDSVLDFDVASGRTAYGSRSEEHTSELQSLMRISYAVFCLKKKKQ